MAGENSKNFVHIMKETCLMKCNTFYEDQCCTSYFKIEGTKILNAPRIDVARLRYLFGKSAQESNPIVTIEYSAKLYFEIWT